MAHAAIEARLHEEPFDVSTFLAAFLQHDRLPLKQLRSDLQSYNVHVKGLLISHINKQRKNTKRNKHTCRPSTL